MSDQIADGPGFQKPKFVAKPDECYFYHSMDLPTFGLQVGHWDLRENVDDYLGRQSFQGKTVLDVGTASGYLCFEMEKRGASVIAFDRYIKDASDDLGLIPFYDFPTRFGHTLEQVVELRKKTQVALQKSFWLSHRLLNSNAQLYCGNVYNGVGGIGEVDYCFFGCILLHLRDPLIALSTFAKITREKLIITDTREEIGAACANMPVMFLRANSRDHGNHGTWWYLTPALLEEYLRVLGFRHFTLTFHRGRSVQANADAEFFTLVADR
jgi:hypothetical protein